MPLYPYKTLAILLRAPTAEVSASSSGNPLKLLVSMGKVGDPVGYFCYMLLLMIMIIVIHCY